MKTLYTNIKQLLGVREKPLLLRGAQLAELPSVEEGFLLIEDNIIARFGRMTELNELLPGLRAQEVDVSGQFVLPTWCDSHTHLVFAKSREDEFVDKIKGKSYAEIAAGGGGILNSAKAIAMATEEELFASGMTRLNEVMALGTGAIEIKSGYGLSLEGELKMLRVIKQMKAAAKISIKSTFLGAHAYPLAFRDHHETYVTTIIEEMIPAISREGLADYIDVFCEQGFFSVGEMVRICTAGVAHGLKPKIHVNQLNSIGGLQAGIGLGALSLDHLETMTAADIHAIGHSNSIGTLLPAAAFFLRMPYQPARELINAGAAIALASDFNPGSSPSGNMNFVVSLSCIQMKMTPSEAINAATLNGAYAMECAQELGSITIGKKANLIFTKPIPSFNYLPYSFGSNLIDKVMIEGRFI